MLKKIFSCFSFLLISTGLVFSQETFDLPGLVDRILSENYQIRILRNEEIINENNNTLGNAGFLPVVSLSGGRSNTVNNTKQKLFNGDIREGKNAENTSLNGLIRVDWNIFNGFGMFARRDQLSVLETISQEETRYLVEQTITDVAGLYYQLVRGRLRLENFEKTLAVSRFRHDLEKKKLGVGSSNALLYNQAFIDYNSDSLLVIDQLRANKSLEIRINRIIRRNPDLQVETINELELEEFDNLGSLVTGATTHNRDLKLADLNELIAETNLKIQKSDMYPTLDVFAQYAYNRSTNEIGVTESNRSYGAQYGFTVRFNLYNGRNERREIRNAQIVTQNTTFAREDISAEIEAIVLDLFFQHESLTRQLSIAEQNVSAAEKSQFIAREQLEKQAISGYDFRLTQLSVINAFNTVTEIKYNLKSLEIELNRLTGRLAEKYL